MCDYGEILQVKKKSGEKECMVILNIVQSCKNIITHIISVFNPDMGICIKNAQLEENILSRCAINWENTST